MRSADQSVPQGGPKQHCREAKPDKAAVNREIRGRLERVKDYDLRKDRWFVVGGDQRRRLEAVFQTTCADSKELADRVETLNRFGLGDVTRPLSTGEALTIKEMAGFHGLDGPGFLKQTVDRVLDETLGRI